MSNKEYFEKLLKDLEYIQQNPRGVQAFSNKVAKTTQISRDLDKRYAEILQSVENNIYKAIEQIADEIRSLYPENKEAAQWLDKKRSKDPNLEGDTSQETWGTTKEFELLDILADDPINSQDYARWINNYVVKTNPTAQRALKIAQDNPTSENANRFFNDIETITYNMLSNQGKGFWEGIKSTPSLLSRLIRSPIDSLQDWFERGPGGKWWKSGRFALRGVLANAYQLPMPQQNQSPKEQKTKDTGTVDQASGTVDLNDKQKEEATLKLIKALEQAKAQGLVDPGQVKSYILKNLNTLTKAYSIVRTLRAQQVFPRRHQAPSANTSSMSDRFIKQLLNDPEKYAENFNHVFNTSYNAKQMQGYMSAPTTTPTAVPTVDNKNNKKGPSENKQTSQVGNIAVHEIKSGDTLSQIAVNYRKQVPGLTWMDIAQHNPDTIKNPNDIRIGTKINIPDKALNAPIPTGYAPVHKRKETNVPKQEAKPVGQPATPVAPGTSATQTTSTKQSKPTKDFDAAKNEIETAFSNQGIEPKDPEKQRAAASEMSKHLRQTAGEGNPASYAKQLSDLYRLNVNQSNQFTDGEKKLTQISNTADVKDPLGVAKFISAYATIAKDKYALLRKNPNINSTDKLEKDLKSDFENLLLIKTYLEHCQLADAADKITRLTAIMSRHAPEIYKGVISRSEG